MEYFKSKTTYITFYKAVCLFLMLLSFFFIYHFSKELWDSREPYIEFFNHNVSHEPGTKDYTNDEMIEFLKTSGISVLMMICSLIGVNIVRNLWKSCPVPGSFIKYWDENGEISHILGRHICSHLRGNLRFRNEDWVHLVKYTENQTYYFYKATRSKNYANIFKKYDGNYKSDYIPGNSEIVKTPLSKPVTTGTNKPANVKNVVINQNQTSKPINKAEEEPKEPTFDSSIITSINSSDVKDNK